VDLVRRYSKLYCGVVYDAMCFDIKYSEPYIVHRAIKPIWKSPEHRVLFGHAFTCKGALVRDESEIDDNVRIKMFVDFSRDCVQVIDAGGDDTVAHFGDISGKIAMKFGARGAVVDGYTRDAEAIERDKFPMFCRGIQPVDAYGKWQIVDYQTDVSLSGSDGDITVRPNDYIFADADGVLVIPNALGGEVCHLAENRLVKEDAIRERLKKGDDINMLYDEIGRW